MLGKQTITFDQLIDFVETQQTVDERNAFLTQLSPENHEQLKWLEQFMQRSTETVLLTPPAEIRAALLEEFQGVFRPTPAPTRWQEIKAKLSFDSWTNQAQLGLAGMRSVEAAPTSRQLAYTSSLVDIVLDVKTAQDKIMIQGQILPHDDAISDQFVVQLVKKDDEIALTESDDFGEFSLPYVTTGQYDIIFCGDDFELTLPLLELS